MSVVISSVIVVSLILAVLSRWGDTMSEKKLDPFTAVRAEYAALQAREDLAVATVAGGCFWCMEGPFEAMDGVEEVIVGYAGGSVENPKYEQVISGETGHREAVQIFFNPEQISYAEILEQYWWQIDPTDADGQFADRGAQYTTALFYHDPEQQKEAELQITNLNETGRYDAPIVTEVLPFTNFYVAEEYHQDFYQKSSEYYQNYKSGSGRAEYIEEMQRRYRQD
ncbi:MAG: peptide-methionine (S)-S-oxide reductase MsrA [Patescibacteria group bacterium]